MYDNSDGLYIPSVELLFIVFGCVGVASAIGLNLLAPQLNLKNPPKILEKPAAEQGHGLFPAAKYDRMSSTHE